MGLSSSVASSSGLGHGQQGPDRGLVTVKEEMDSTVYEIQGSVDMLGTPVDTPEFRKQLQDRWRHAHQLAREASTLLKEPDQTDDLRDTQKINKAILAEELLAVFGRFNKAKLIAAEKYPAFVPKLEDITTSRFRSIHEAEVNKAPTPSKKDSDGGSLLEESKRMLALLEDSEKTLQEVTAEENEEEVRLLQAQIDSLRLIFKDLIILDEYSGDDIDGISARIEESAAASSRARSRLLKAHRPRSFLDCFCRILSACFSVGT